MNLRERTLAILRKEKPDYVPWLGDLDYWYNSLVTQGALPQKYLGDGLFQLHRDLGVGFYLQGYYPFQAVMDGIEIIQEVKGNLRQTRVVTPQGELRRVGKYLPDSYCWAYEEHLVRGWQGLKARIRPLSCHNDQRPACRGARTVPGDPGLDLRHG